MQRFDGLATRFGRIALGRRQWLATRLPAVARVLPRLAPRSDMLWSMADQILISGASFAIGVLAARALGIAEFGRFAVILIVVTLMQAIHNVLIVAPMLTLSGQRARRTPHYYSAIMAWSWLLATAEAAAVAALVGLMFGLRDGVWPGGLMAAAAVCTAFQSVHFTVRRMLFVRGVGWQAFALDLVRYSSMLAGAVGWISLSQPTAAMMLTLLGGSALFSILPFLRSLPQGRIHLRLMSRVWGRHWPFSRWLLVMTGLTFAHEQAIYIGIGMLLGDKPAGGLRAGQYLLGITHIIMAAMENVVPVGAARARSSGGLPRLRRYLIRQMIWLGIPIGMLILTLAAPAEWWLSTVFGPAYAEYATVLRIYAVSYAFVFIRDIWTYHLRTVERTDLIVRAFVPSFLVTLAIFYPAIAWFGLPGAAAVVCISNAISAACIVLAVARRPGRDPGHPSGPAEDGPSGAASDGNSGGLTGLPGRVVGTSDTAFPGDRASAGSQAAVAQEDRRSAVVREVEDEAEWEALLATHPLRSIYCSWGWGRYKAAVGWKPLRLRVDDGGGICGLCQVQIKRQLGRRMIFLQGAPLFFGAEERSRQSQALAAMLDHIGLRRLDLVGLNFYGYRTGATVATVLSAGFHPVLSSRNFTATLDLSGGLDAIRSGMSRVWRQNLQSATGKHRLERRFVTDPAGRRAALERFKPMHERTAKRKGFAVAIDVDAFKDVVATDERYVIVEILQGREVIAVRIAHVAARLMTDFFAASNDVARGTAANYLAVWSLLEYAVEHGLEAFDTGGADPRGNEGVFRFKWGLTRAFVQSDPLWIYSRCPALRRVAGLLLTWK